MRKQSNCLFPALQRNASHWGRPIQILSARSMNNLANLYYDKQGQQHVKAESLILVDCLSKREVVVSADHPDTIRTRNDLDKVCSRK
jgi:hypothetical protein